MNPLAPVARTARSARSHRSRALALLAAVGTTASMALAAGEADVASAARGAAAGASAPRSGAAAQSARKSARTPRRVSRRRSPVARSTIVNGYVPHPSQWPWMAALVRKGASNDYQGQFCGGTLVRPNLVVTAAHCLTDDAGRPDVQASGLQIVLGRRVLSDSSTGERIDAAAITVHPNYRGHTEGYDVAVVRLVRPAVEAPAVLGDSDWGTQATAMGWGDTYGGSTAGSDRLLAADLPLLSDGQCASYYRSYKPATMMCAGGAGSGTCQGDSGGPLMVAIGGTWKLVGAMSYGWDGCPTDKPRVMAWVAGPTLRPWIVAQMAAADVPAPAPSAPARPAATPPPADTTAPTISTLNMTPNRFKSAKRGASISAAVGASVTYRLSEAATVKFTLARCGTLKRRTRCRSLRGTLTHRGQVGLNRFGFSGRLRSRLAPGRYRLVARAADAAGNRSAPESVDFRIVRR